jgi:hypothetical protein
VGTDGTFSDVLELGHLHLNRPSDQLSPRTPAAIFKADVRTDASLDLSSNLSRPNSAPAAGTALCKSSFFYPFFFSNF